MNLFEERQRDRLTPAGHLENPYHFYDSSSRERMASVRELLNSWFRAFPEEHREELKTRFSKDFYPAFFELFTHQLFWKLGLIAEVHPIQHNSNRRPDFLFKNSEIEFVVESKLAKDRSKEDEVKENRERHFFDLLNKAKSKDFFIQIANLQFKTNDQPPTKEIVGQIESWLDSLDPDQVRFQIEHFGLTESPKLVIENEKVLLEISPLPKNKEHRGKSARIIGIYPAKGFMGGSEISIKKAIERKAPRYGSFSRPFLLAINAISHKGLDSSDVFRAIFGSWPNNDNEIIPLEKMCSVTFDLKRPRNTRVSAFFITNVNPHNLHVANYWLVEHPFAENKMDLNKLNLAHYQLVGNKLLFREGRTIRDVLELNERYWQPEDWLEE